MARLRPLLPVLGVALLGALVAVVALGRFSVTAGDLGPGRVEVRAGWHFGGRTELQLPPLGEIKASTHRSPLALQARVDQIDVDAVQRLLVADEPGERLRAEIEDGLPGLLRRLAFRSLLSSLVLGAVAGALISRHHLRRTLAGAGGGVIVTAALLGWAALGYDADAFAKATFHGPLARAPAIVEAVERNVEGLAEVPGKVATLSRQVAGLYRTTASDVVPPSDQTVILHVSDIHSNPLGVEVARQLAQSFRVDAVLDTGDLTSFGLPVEARIAELLQTFPAPYYLVPGNHDSLENRVAIDAIPNVTVIDGQAVDIAGVRVLGISDPTFTANNEVSTEDANAIKRSRAPEVATATRLARPDVLAVHDARQAARCFGIVPVIVAGHAHEQASTEEDGTHELLVGSTGATGIGSFTVETDLAYEAQLLRFDGDDLVAVDYVSLEGIDGNFTITRQFVRPIPTVPE